MTVVRSNFEYRKNNFYETPTWCVDTLLAYWKPDVKRIWEPAAGGHKIVNALKSHGYEVVSSDIAEYGVKHDLILDFLNKDQTNPFGVDTIITNPPYGPSNAQAVKFARNALMTDGIKRVAMLLTAKFDFGSTRTDLFQNNPAFVGKIALLDRISWADNGKTGTEDHAWYLWDKSNTDRPRIWYGGENRYLEA